MQYAKIPRNNANMITAPLFLFLICIIDRRKAKIGDNKYIRNSIALIILTFREFLWILLNFYDEKKNALKLTHDSTLIIL